MENNNKEISKHIICSLCGDIKDYKCCKKIYEITIDSVIEYDTSSSDLYMCNSCFKGHKFYTFGNDKYGVSLSKNRCEDMYFHYVSNTNFYGYVKNHPNEHLKCKLCNKEL